MVLLASLGAALMLLAALLSMMSVYQTWPGRQITDESRDRVQQLRVAAAIAAGGGAVLCIWRLLA